MFGTVTHLAEEHTVFNSRKQSCVSQTSDLLISVVSPLLYSTFLCPKVLFGSLKDTGLSCREAPSTGGPAHNENGGPLKQKHDLGFQPQDSYLF